MFVFLRSHVQGSAEVWHNFLFLRSRERKIFFPGDELVGAVDGEVVLTDAADGSDLEELGQVENHWTNYKNGHVNPEKIIYT